MDNHAGHRHLPKRHPSFQQSTHANRPCLPTLYTQEGMDALSRRDIWARLTTCKFPLLQLVAVFPRPPLTFGTECFVLLHLLGDPIFTIVNLLLKVASCQARAALWKYRLRPNGEEKQLMTLWAGLTRTPTPDGLWKGLTAIVDSYDEWGPDIGTKVQELIFDRL